MRGDKQQQQPQQRGFSSQSLFAAAANSKSNKLKSNLITINFAESNLVKLVHSLGNQTSRHHTHQRHTHHMVPSLRHFNDLFDLNKFNKELVDYSTFHDCRKQLHQTGFKASEPMCLLHLESSSVSATPTGISSLSIGGIELDYDYYDTASVLGDDHFSVQTSFVEQQSTNRANDDDLTTSFYLASACVKRKRPIRNSNQFGSLTKDLTQQQQQQHPKPKYQVRLNENRNSPVVLPLSAAPILIDKNTDNHLSRKKTLIFFLFPKNGN